MQIETICVDKMDEFMGDTTGGKYTEHRTLMG
jgi:hypothetical protein